MDPVYMNGVSVIALIQERLQQHESFLLLLSKLFDPRYAFLLFSPLVFSLDSSSGIQLVWTTVAAEFVNQILKWLLMSDRPYWWVRSTLAYNATNSVAPQLKQFPLTCETGPGSPSGHAMLTAAVWFVMINAVLRHYRKHRLPTLGPLQVVLWVFYLSSIVGVSISRLYLSAHFPHQCILGAVLGAGVAGLISRVEVKQFRLKTYVSGTVFMLAVVASSFALLRAFHVDPSWTIAKAVKWCIRKEFVHLDTTPFYSIMRYTGFFLGTGIGLTFAPEPLVVRPPHISRPNETMKVRGINLLKALVSILAVQLLSSIAIPTDNMSLFYVLAFLVSVVQPILFVAVVPLLVNRVFAIDGKRRQD